MTRTLLLLVLTGLSLGAQAAFQDLESIREAARQHVARELASGATAQAQALDPRLRLQACGQSLRTRALNGARGAQRTIEVRCDGPQPWNLFVPVRVQNLQDVYVLTRHVRAGETIGHGDFRRERRETSGYGAVVQDLNTIVGRIASRPLSAGSILTTDVLAAAPTVRRGQMVTIIGRAGTFEVRATGKAMDDAPPGGRVAVQNSSSKRIVHGTVANDGSVRVDF